MRLRGWKVGMFVRPYPTKLTYLALQVRPEYIVPLVEELHGKKWPKFNSEKICHIAYGRIQVGAGGGWFEAGWYF